MEDPGEEWSIEGYCAYSDEDDGESKRSWLNKGLSLGKTVLMTGVVISSAPLILPPLVVASALGFAFSVPFGVAFASYTCTEKLMSKLLPIPAAKMLEYGPLLEDEEEFEMEEEEKRQKEDTREEVETRIELEEGENVLPEKGEKSLINIEEGGYEENVGEYLEGKDEGSLGGINAKIQGQGEEVEKELLTRESKNEESPPVVVVVKRVVVVVPEQEGTADDVQKTDGLVLVGREVRGGTGSAGKVTQTADAVLPKEETTGLLEEVRDEGHSGEHMKKNKKKNKLRLKNWREGES